MRAINHALTGAAIGLIVADPVIALPTALVSHYILDAIPHHGVNRPNDVALRSLWFRYLLIADTVLCVFLVVMLVLFRPHHWITATVCAFVAAAPDLASFGRYKSALRHQKPTLNRYQKFAGDIQWFERPTGAVVEVVWFIAACIVVAPFFVYR